ncbi:DUF1826 domain-containing protein [Sneathiella sp. P13V-1]|uniref:DUF1826 domain-containing protein n=1 Tax=Sneathiella sp. P13V-1 TaxID=2697366 RepID=UPI00187B38C2|nr:DUF1826 domain-containing protein [Sneathiella sp. P13V-1]MBE7638685.1 DUF1826 domain-containing protein [Sneathiella sp. P13V-1]
MMAEKLKSIEIDHFNDGVYGCQTIEDLSAIKRQDVELAVWSRNLSQAFQSWINQIDPITLPDLRLLLRPEDLEAALTPLLNACGLPRGEMRDYLLEDIDRLVQAFSDISGSEYVDVRLERVTNDACWKFHRDCVEARLITTYRGPSTEWVQHFQAAEALEKQKDYQGPLEQFDLFDVAFFKGSCAGSGSGIVHRSPPISGTDQTRLILCLNQPSTASPDYWR